MRAGGIVLVLFAPALLAGCTGGGDGEDGGTPRYRPPGLHTTDCLVAPDGDTCRRSTDRTPLAVSTWPSGNRSRIGFLLTNGGNGTLTFDTDPPVLWLYARADDGVWRRIAIVQEGRAPGAELAASASLNLTAHYGRVHVGDVEKGVSWSATAEPERWPANEYRACLSAHLDGSAGWVRACRDVRVAAR